MVLEKFMQSVWPLFTAFCGRYCFEIVKKWKKNMQRELFWLATYRIFLKRKYLLKSCTYRQLSIKPFPKHHNRCDVYVRDPWIFSSIYNAKSRGYGGGVVGFPFTKKVEFLQLYRCHFQTLEIFIIRR